MAVYFVNESTIDLNTIRLMGVSIKTTDSPIGYFGTGLKFAIATILRHGLSIKLLRGDTDVYTFSVHKTDVRGEVFDIVCMNDEPLSFTTSLGKNWELWQAYRELYCNCLDEDGQITTDDSFFERDGLFGTIFVVEGSEFEAIHYDKHKIFLESKAIFKTSLVEMHRHHSERYIFYRGVRAGETSKRALFTYNFLGGQRLTEDRTLVQGWPLDHALANAIIQCTDEACLRAIMFADPVLYMEGSLAYATLCTVQPSDTFLELMSRYKGNMRVNQQMRKFWQDYTETEDVFEAIEPNTHEQAVIEKALALLKRVFDITYTLKDFTIVERLGNDVHGVVKQDRIIIARTAIDIGYRYFASTLYEEHLHLTEGFLDESRSMQNFLLNKLMALAERIEFLETPNNLPSYNT